MAKIYAPNKRYTGISASVSFVNGVGETNRPELLAWFSSNGYEVVQDEPIKSIDKMNVSELKAYAVQNKIELGGATKKDEILTIIKGGG